ncbi:hypothetical protein FACS189444_1360 [Spirochaetia bacterium]|nr:hypothetical protein FACS189444_1360 [Spirochaetia bacterium]
MMLNQPLLLLFENTPFGISHPDIKDNIFVLTEFDYFKGFGVGPQSTYPKLLPNIPTDQLDALVVAENRDVFLVGDYDFEELALHLTTITDKKIVLVENCIVDFSRFDRFNLLINDIVVNSL